MSKVIKMTWRCPSCDNVYETFSNIHLNIHVCECGKCGVDLDELISRQLGDVQVIKTEILDD